MALEVLLMDDVPDLGAEGDVVKVADGFARNYLYPKQLAAPVTQGMRRRLAKLQEQRREERAMRDREARVLGEAISADSYTIAVKVGENERLYGSVTSADIAEVITRAGHAVDKQWIELETPIRELGVYDLKVHMAPSVSADIKLWVVEE